jgi:hypothetical protein
MIAIQILLFAGFALLGRWLQLHQERVFPKGYFVAVNSWGAKLARAQVAVVGTFAVVGGTAGSISRLLSVVPVRSQFLAAAIVVIGLSAGVMAAIYVRKEVRVLPPHQSTDPNGWWPS